MRWLKLLVAVGLLGALATGLDWSTLAAHLHHLDGRYAAAALLIVVLELLANASKWFWSLALHGLRYSWSFLLRVGCIAFFANNLLPSAIGGDVYRVYRTIPPDRRKTTAISAVLVERAVGLAVLVAIGILGATALAARSPWARDFLIAVLAGTVCAAIAGFSFARYATLHAARISARFPRLAPVVVNLNGILRARHEWLPLAAWSIVFQSLTVAYVYCAFAAVAVPLPLYESALISAAAGVAAAIPISISGLGVVEGSVAGVAVAVGTGYEEAVLGAIMMRLLVLPISAGCGLVYALEPRGGSVAAKAENI